MLYVAGRAILADLDPETHRDLSVTLSALSIEVVDSQRSDADIVFCSLPAVEGERRIRPQVPLIAVSRQQDVAEWLDAMEAGASDYCAAPFEPVHLRRVLKSGALSSVRRAA